MQLHAAMLRFVLGQGRDNTLVFLRDYTLTVFCPAQYCAGSSLWDRQVSPLSNRCFCSIGALLCSIFHMSLGGYPTSPGFNASADIQTSCDGAAQLYSNNLANTSCPLLGWRGHQVMTV